MGTLMNVFEALYPRKNFQWKFREQERNLGLCPFHSDHHPSLSLYVDISGRERWRCFTENIGGTDVDAVMKSKDCTRTEANTWLRKNGFAEESEAQAKASERDMWIKKFLGWTNRMLVNDEVASGLRAYITSRGVDIATLPNAPVGMYPSSKLVRDWLTREGVPDEFQCDFLPKVQTSTNMDGGIIFFYRSAYDSFAMLKIRNVLKEDSNTHSKKIQVLGKGRTKEEAFIGGYFTWSMDSADDETAIIVEGEFDVGALFSLGYKHDNRIKEPIYCFGGTGGLQSGIRLLRQIGKTNVSIFVDNDSPGRMAADKICHEDPYCAMLEPETYEEGDDPNSWAQKSSYLDLQTTEANPVLAYKFILKQSLEDFANNQGNEREQASIKKRLVDYLKLLRPSDQEEGIKLISDPLQVSPEIIRSDLDFVSGMVFRKITSDVQNYGIQQNVAGPDKPPRWVQISNVTVDLGQDVIMDHGDGWEVPDRSIVLKVHSPMHETIIKMSAYDWADSKRTRDAMISVLGSELCVDPKKWDDFKRAIQQFDMNKGRVRTPMKIADYTGWRNERFYMPNCVIDKDGYHVDEDDRAELPTKPDYYNCYHLNEPSTGEDLERAKDLIRNSLLKVYSSNITMPFLAHMFLCPLQHFIPSDPLALWLVGMTGSFKTSYASVMASFFGNFLGGHFESWGSTGNSLTEHGFLVKDLPYVIDDYKKATIKDSIITQFLQNYGNKQSRSRMTVDMKSRPNHPVRGSVISTGEDIPTGEASALARCLVLSVTERGNSEALTECQTHIDMLSGVMSGYIQYLCKQDLNPEKMADLIQKKRTFFAESHARVAQNLAVNAIAWDFLSDYLNFHDLDQEYLNAILGVTKGMNIRTFNELAGVQFIEGVQDLLATGRCYFEGLNGAYDTAHDADRNATRLGWWDGRGYYIPFAPALAAVNKLKLESETSTIKYSKEAIMNQLVLDNVIIPSATRPTVSKRINKRVVRLLWFKPGTFEGGEPDAETEDPAEFRKGNIRPANQQAPDLKEVAETDAK